jgi:hypothetical protein
MRRFAAILLMAISVGAAVAQDVTYTTLTIAYGKVRRKDGTYANIAGMKVPAKIERVKATTGHRPPASFFDPLVLPPQTHSSMVLQPLYWADQDPNNTNSSPYGEIDSTEFSSCSVLDDIQVNTNAINVAWQQLTFGMDNPTPHDFLIRWTVWNAYNPNAPDGTSAFSPYPVPSTYLLDFGVKWPHTQTQVGPIKVTINIASAQVYAPQTNFWFSSQFRQWQGGNPNAPFDDSVKNLFNQSSPPQMGFSDIYYWLDYVGSGADGKYEEQEKDIFGDASAPLQGNLLLKIEGNLSGSITDRLPTGVTLEKGVYVSGDFSDLWDSDNIYYKAKPDYTLQRGVDPIQLRIDGKSPSSNINSISFTLETGCDGGSAIQKIQLFRFRGPSPGWVDVDTHTVTAVDSNFTYVYTNANPEYFVNTDPSDLNRIRARVLLTPGTDTSRGFDVRFDHAKWTIGTP